MSTSAGKENFFSRIKKAFRNESSASVRRIPGFDPEKHIPAIRCSICTGEQVGGYEDPANGNKFNEVMLIQSEEDLKEFQQMVGTDKIKKIY